MRRAGPRACSRHDRSHHLTQTHTTPVHAQSNMQVINETQDSPLRYKPSEENSAMIEEMRGLNFGQQPDGKPGSRSNAGQ